MAQKGGIDLPGKRVQAVTTNLVFPGRRDESPYHHHSLLSSPAVRAQLGRGVIISPYVPRYLHSCSYDVRIGPYYYRRQDPVDTGGVSVYNPLDPDAVALHLGKPQRAKPATKFKDYQKNPWKHIDPTDPIILMRPGELILGHTIEYIGGTKDPETGRCFTAEMKARSSIGRVGFEVCRCAGWGDVGYVNRWTLEIKNDSGRVIILVVGMRVGQMKFYEVDSIPDEEMYGADASRDHYQFGVDLRAIRRAWKPQMMVPRLTKD